MQFKTITLATLVGLAAAAPSASSDSSSSDVSSLVSQIPSCANTCLDQGAAAADCGDSDYSCQCDNQATITANASSCLVTSCSVSDISTTKSVVSEICDAVNGGSSNSSSSLASTNSSSSTASSSSSSASSSSSSSSAGARTDLYKGLGWAVVGVLAAMMSL